MKVENINKVLRVERMTQGMSLLMPFIMLRPENDNRIIPVWMEIVGGEPSDDVMIRLALRKDVVISKDQNLKFWKNLPTFDPGVGMISKEAHAYTAHHWAKWGRKGEPIGDFRLFKGSSRLGWVFGTYADSRAAAEQFIAENESRAA